MNIFSGIVVFVIFWWLIFFCTLPMGIKTIEKTEGGNMPGAPVDPGLKRKVILTTAIAFIVWFGAYLIIKSDWLSFHDMALRMSH